MLDKEQMSEFNEYKGEFQNPSCYLLYTNLCELICLELYSNDPISLSRSICPSLIDLFFANRFSKSIGSHPIESDEFVYWINAAGLLIANLPESYWSPIYERIADMMQTHPLLNSVEFNINLFDHFDICLAEEKHCFDEVTLIIAIFHSIWCHSSANHFQYFIK